jgi:hypothetical protein
MHPAVRSFVPLVILTLAACGRKGPEARVQAAFEQCCAAVEDGDATRAAEPLDPAFRGPDGMDRATARLFLAGLLRRERVGITVVRNQIRRDGPEVVQEVDLLITGRSGGLLPDETSRRRFLLRWRERGGDWRLTEVQAPGGP